MRLMAIGQHDGHTLLARLLAEVPALAAEIADGSESAFGSFAPALDIAAMSQQYGHSRLFRS
jgi:urease accessory protein UreF